ncbi:polysaccharide pyruvyl transferase family protein [Bosea sp. NPDC055594]
MAKYLNLHRLKTENIGDLMCAPVLYFPELKDSARAEIRGFHREEGYTTEERKSWLDQVQSSENIIVGGGGLLEIDYFRDSVKAIFSQKNPKAKTIFWGGGHNNWIISDWRRLKQVINLKDMPFDLVGVRDAGHPYDWVPCVTCMHEVFDKKFDTSREVVVYAHSATLANENFRKTLPTGLPILTNNKPFDEVIAFLGSAELILTDSYHGLYWGTLLGKRVVAFPTSSKFYDVMHPAPLCAPSDWRRFAPLAKTYPGALAECREANRSFLQKVLNV